MARNAQRAWSGLQAEAAADDLLHDLGGAAEDRLDATEPPELIIVADKQRTSAPADQGEPPELNVTFSMSFFFPRVLGQQEYEDEGGRQGDEADP